LQNVARLAEIDEKLGKDLYRIACYADLVPAVAEGNPIRVYQTGEFLQDNGEIIQLLIYFVLHPDDTVELQHIEAVNKN